MSKILSVLLLLLALALSAADAHAAFWQLPGKRANDIAISHTGHVYIVSDEPAPGGFCRLPPEPFERLLGGAAYLGALWALGQ